MNIQASLNSMLGDVSRLAFSKTIVGAAKTSQEAAKTSKEAAEAQKKTEELKQSKLKPPERTYVVDTEFENYVKERPEMFAGPNSPLLIQKKLDGSYVGKMGRKRYKLETETVNRLREKTDNKKNQSTALKERFEYFTEEGPQVWEV